MSHLGTAIVTGGAKRIGREIAVALAKKGFDIALHYNKSNEDAQKLAKEIETTGQRCQLFSCDFNSTQAVKSFATEMSKIKDCTLLVNNASIFERGVFLETDQDLLDRHFNINFKAPFLLSQMFAKTCNEGQIINIIDTKITKPFNKFFAYSLSKKMLYEFTLMLAKELAPKIRVNAICPGIILPPPDGDEEVVQRLASKTPLQRKGNVEDIISALSFFVDNKFVTGECLFVDGGEHLK